MSVLHILKVATSNAKKRCMLGFNWLLFRWLSRWVYGGSIVYNSNAIKSLQISALKQNDKQQKSKHRPNVILHWTINVKQPCKTILITCQNFCFMRSYVSQVKLM